MCVCVGGRMLRIRVERSELLGVVGVEVDKLKLN